jgi:hypothetical protein
MNTQLEQLAKSSGIYRMLQGESPGTSTPPETSVLPEPLALAGNAVTQLAMLMTQVDQQDQKTASAARDAADQAIEQSDAQHVQDLRDKAGADEGAAWASGVGEIAGGCLSLGGALSESTDPSLSAGTLAANRAIADRWDAVAKVAPGLGTIGAGQLKAAGDTDDANAAADKSASDAAQRRYDQAKSDAQSAADSIQKVEQYLQTVLQTQEATNLKAAGGPG